MTTSRTAVTLEDGAGGSIWGWGRADRFADREARRQVGRDVAALLGVRPPEPREPVPLEAARLPPPRVPVPAALATFATAAPADRARHAHGRGFRDLVRGFAGDYTAAPDLVVTPRTEEDVETALAVADEADLAVVPFGGGTSVVGGVEGGAGGDVPDGLAGVLCLDLRALDRVLEVDPVSRAARIQAGARGPVLEAQLAEHGSTLRFYPQSFELSTLGGWLATRAGGHFATGPTHVDDLTESIRMLTPRGVWESRRLPASGAGPSPDRLVLGSEGTLGVITEAWMRVLPRPTHRARASVRFRSWPAALDAVRAVAQSGLAPANCRLLDPGEALLNGVASGEESVLLLAFESADHDQQPSLDRALRLAAAYGGERTDAPGTGRGPGGSGSPRDAGSWRDAFLEAPYRFNSLVSLGLVVDTVETAVTWDRLPALHERVVGDVREALRAVCGAGVVTCRLTHVYPDGAAPYYTFLAPGRPGEELAQWAEVKAAASEAVLSAGGTITHHHAVGRLHRPWARQQRPPLFGAVLAAAKAEVDPRGLLNPGCLL